MSHYDRIVRGSGIVSVGRARIAGVPGARQVLRSTPAAAQFRGATRNNPGPRLIGRVGAVRLAPGAVSSGGKSPPIGTGQGGSF